MGLCPKPHQGGSPTLDPPAADVARHGSPAACRSCLDDAIHRFRAGQLRWPGCAQSAQQKTCVRPRKMSKLIFSDCRRFFFCPEALFAIFKLQAQIVCERSQADSPGAFFAAFFLRKKARIPLCQFLFVCFETGNRIRSRKSPQRILTAHPPGRLYMPWRPRTGPPC